MLYFILFITCEVLLQYVTQSILCWDNNLRILTNIIFSYSGTEKQAVAYDYAERIAYGISQCQVSYAF